MALLKEKVEWCKLCGCTPPEGPKIRAGGREERHSSPAEAAGTLPGEDGGSPEV